MSLIQTLIASVTERGHALEREYFRLQRTLQAPVEMLNTGATDQISAFFSDVVELGARFSYLRQQQSCHVAFVFSPYNVAGHGCVLASVKREELLFLQLLKAGPLGSVNSRLWIAQNTDKLAQFRQHESALHRPHGLVFYEPRPMWTAKSYFVRIKLLEQPLPAILSRRVGVGPEDGFFFLGFFECFLHLSGQVDHPPCLDSYAYKPSTPQPSVQCLQFWISAAQSRAQLRETRQARLKEEGYASRGGEASGNVKSATGADGLASKGKEAEVIIIEDDDC